MVFYIASPTYQPLISSVIKENELVLAGSESSSEIYINKYIKEHISDFSGFDVLVIDLSCVMDLENEITDALEMLKVMYSGLRIVLLASSLVPGCSLLVKCVQMSIYDIICSEDFGEIRDELRLCLTEGKTYRDAVRFRTKGNDEKGKAAESGQLKKKVVNRIMIGVAGSQKRIGVTHTAIVIANTLRRRGYMVALVEMSQAPVFEDIREAFEEELSEKRSFSLNGIDYYPASDALELNAILEKAYNFLVIDFGEYTLADLLLFNKCDIPVAVAGSKPWEIEQMQEIFNAATYGNLVRYNFVFNFTPDKSRNDIRIEMGSNEFRNVFFAPVTMDPYAAVEEGFVNDLCGSYMNEESMDKKGRRIFPWKRKK